MYQTDMYYIIFLKNITDYKITFSCAFKVDDNMTILTFLQQLSHFDESVLIILLNRNNNLRFLVFPQNLHTLRRKLLILRIRKKLMGNTETFIGT